MYHSLNSPLSIVLPIFLSNPCLDIGIPVARAIFCFVCVIPKARFQEKDNPGIFNVVFFVMLLS